MSNLKLNQFDFYIFKLIGWTSGFLVLSGTLIMYETGFRVSLGSTLGGDLTKVNFVHNLFTGGPIEWILLTSTILSGIMWARQWIHMINIISYSSIPKGESFCPANGTGR